MHGPLMTRIGARASQKWMWIGQKEEAALWSRCTFSMMLAHGKQKLTEAGAYMSSAIRVRGPAGEFTARKALNKFSKC